MTLHRNHILNGSNVPFEGYIGFLQHNGMIELVGNSARITQLGLEYLAWRVETRKPLKPYR